MSNHCEININGKSVGLTFGMIAAEEFNRLQIEKSLDPNSVNGTLLMADVIYCGAVNRAYLDKVQPPKYADIVDGVDEIFSDDERLPELDAVSKIYTESRMGKHLEKQTAAIKKKLAENQNLSIGETSESLPTES